MRKAFIIRNKAILQDMRRRQLSGNTIIQLSQIHKPGFYKIKSRPPVETDHRLLLLLIIATQKNEF